MTLPPGERDDGAICLGHQLHRNVAGQKLHEAIPAAGTVGNGTGVDLVSCVEYFRCDIPSVGGVVVGIREHGSDSGVRFRCEVLGLFDWCLVRDATAFLYNVKGGHIGWPVWFKRGCRR